VTSHRPEPWSVSRATPGSSHTVMPEAPGSSIHPSTQDKVNNYSPDTRYSAVTDRVSHHAVSRLPSLCKRRTQIHLQPINRIHRSVPRMHLALLLLLLLLLLLSSRRPVLVLSRGHQEHHRRSRRSRTPETRKGRQRHPLRDASSQLLILLFQSVITLPISAPDPRCYVR
jgi:hypothetical protein